MYMYVSVCVVLEGKGINSTYWKRDSNKQVCSQPSEPGVLETSKVD